MPDKLSFAAQLEAAANDLPMTRACSPEASHVAIIPYLARCGVTRAASVTGLDRLGLPTWVSVRPNGLILQVSNGKGLTDAAARMSAVMEAIELTHAETPVSARLVTAPAKALTGEVISFDRLPGGRGGYWAPDYVTEWTSGAPVAGGLEVWVPSSAIYFERTPNLFDLSSNGLASGNTAGEAQLHGLYELIERDAMCRLREAGRLKVRERAQVMDLDTITSPALRLILDRCAEKNVQVVLMALPTAVSVHSFWAVFLDQDALAGVSTLNTGWGCHADPQIAAVRALTEAAQSRLGFIHGARDDRLRKPVHGATGVKTSPAFRFFETLAGDVAWSEVASRDVLLDLAGPEVMVARLDAALTHAGLGPVWRFDLTDPKMGIPVWRMICPGLAFDKRLF
jgi:ribosomal protein S12 methylthiotransferase accessory factor